jgi:hypothetical protein
MRGAGRSMKYLHSPVNHAKSVARETPEQRVVL